MYIEVLIETKVKSNNMTFTYYAPEQIDNDLIGKRVLVPFNNREEEGFVLKKTIKPDDYDVKEIIKVIDDEKVLTEELINLGKFMSEKYLCPLINCYQAMLPKSLKANHKVKDNIKFDTYITLNPDIRIYDAKVKQQLEIINM